ncbi:hypothetical protein WUBG_10785 [Wuchereria bancrofti]|uniref:Uncharacterized protein n=1 Tax=Wuchereria bancrofti TaxID=6293 RepID=J9AUY0_WUCBA|nr:hypothetical protein WUBG_10785 [Wuchereria bancrofti]
MPKYLFSLTFSNVSIFCSFFIFRKSSPLRSSLMKRENRNRSSHTKFVSFSTQKHEKKICNVSDCIQMMQNETEFIKLRTNIRQFRRTFALDSNLSHIHWTPTNKKPNKAKS